MSLAVQPDPTIVTSIRILKISDTELATLAGSPFAAETLSDSGGLVVLVESDGEVDAAKLTEDLASLPCIVIAVDRTAEDVPTFADLSIESAIASIDDILGAVEHNPVAATSLVLCLREAPTAIGRALIAESAVYSTLQAGAEFQGWLRSRRPREHGPEPAPQVRIERDGARLELVLNRPEVRNALSTAMRDELLEGLALASADRSIIEVVFRGEGPSFCSGGYLDEFGGFSDPASAHVVRLTTSIGRAIDGLNPRIRIEVHGPCAGSGVELAAFGARVIAKADFTAVLPEVRLGLIPGAGGTWSITRRIGRQRMALLALSGAVIDAPTALGWGLVDEVTAT